MTEAERYKKLIVQEVVDGLMRIDGLCDELMAVSKRDIEKVSPTMGGVGSPVGPQVGGETLETRPGEATIRVA